MGWFRDTLELYARAFRRGAVLALRNWPVALVLLGFRMLLDLVAGLEQGGASAALVASLFHYGEHTVREAKEHLARRGIAVRL